MPGASQTSVFNVALVALGEEPLSMIATGSTKVQRLLLARWDDSRQALLTMGWWNCARVRATLAADAQSPAFQYDYRYALPADCLEVVDLPEIGDLDWIIDGGASGGNPTGYLLTDAPAPLDIVYIQDVTDPGRFPPLFAQALGYRLAAEIAPSITQSRAKAEDMLERSDQLAARGLLADFMATAPDTRIMLAGLADEENVMQITKAYRHLRMRETGMRQAMIRDGQWNFTKTRVQLTASGTAPLFGYANSYPLPDDFIKMFDLPVNDGAIWSIEDGNLLTDELSPLDAIYFQDQPDSTLWDPLFQQAYDHALAAELALTIASDVAKAKGLAAEAERFTRAARLAGSQENAIKEWDEDVLLRSRR